MNIFLRKAYFNKFLKYANFVRKSSFHFCTIFSKVKPASGIVNLATRNQLVTKYLNKFAKNQTTAIVNIDDKINNSELKNLTLIVRNKITASIILADFHELQNENFWNKSEKLSLVSEQLKNGFLILLLFGASIKKDETRFLTKTIIIRGKVILLFPKQ